MERRRILAWFMRNVWKRNKLAAGCVLGILCLLYLNPDTRVDFDQYKLVIQNYSFTATARQAKIKPTSPPVPDGYELARTVKSLCTRRNNIPEDSSYDDDADHITVRYSRNRDVMLCPVYKVGSTFWRRVFMMQSDRAFRQVRNPYQIPFDKEFKSGHYRIMEDRRANFTFMFTRDPYSRIFSTYVDKLLAPNPYYWKVLGEKIIKLTRKFKKPPGLTCGHDVTFPEFINYVIHSLDTNGNVDPHFVQIDQNCRPCDVQYDFIGKMESFSKDSAVCLEKLNLNGVVELLKTNGSDLSAQDAILDTMTQPFSFRKHYTRCITFTEAIQRAWKKLQIRGLIGDDVLDLSAYGKGLNGVSLQKLISLARKSRENSTSSTRRKLKQDFYEFFWRQINVTDLLRLKSLYSADFKLFNYEAEPASVFQNRKF